MLVDPQRRKHVHPVSHARRTIERALVAAGTLLLLAFVAGQAHRAILMRAEMNRFKREMKAESDNIVLSSKDPGVPRGMRISQIIQRCRRPAALLIQTTAYLTRGTRSRSYEFRS